ncbi:hypothetical protein DFH09DRAFT_1124826 [Mycena vulgaris]|nr:hypothetical protein DFH09DRAFT_1124826 [Mycena vulgaris]
MSPHTSGSSCYCSKCQDLWDRKQTQSALWQHSVITVAPSSKSGPLWLYHGTSITNAQRIVQGGPSLPQERNGAPSPGQFSYHGAFYLTDKLEAAAEYAVSHSSGASHIAVLAFPWNGAKLRIQEYRDQSWLGFVKYFIFSMTNFGHDVTTIFSFDTFKKVGLVRGKGKRARRMTLDELRWKAAKTVRKSDMITGPMLNVLSKNVWQYAITTRKGLHSLGTPRTMYYPCW